MSESGQSHGFDRAGVHSVFRRMLQARELSFDNDAVLEEALFNWEDSTCGFAGCLIAAHKCGRSPPPPQVGINQPTDNSRNVAVLARIPDLDMLTDGIRSIAVRFH